MPIACSRMRRVALGMVLGVLIGWGGFAGAAHAALVTFSFEGNVNAVGTPISSDFHVGDTFQGSYSFNSLTPDRDSRSNVGAYTLANGMFTVSGKSYVMGGGTAGGIRIVSNASPGFRESYVVDFTAVGPSAGNGNYIPGAFALSLEGRNHFLNDSLPLTPPSLSGLAGNDISFRLNFISGGARFVGGEITSLSLTAVPLPGAVLLFGSGLLGLAAFGRCRLMRSA